MSFQHILIFSATNYNLNITYITYATCYYLSYFILSCKYTSEDKINDFFNDNYCDIYSVRKM